MDGITKEKLENLRKELLVDIAELETDEKAQSSVIHLAVSKKSELRAQVVFAKNELVLLDGLIGDCVDLGSIK